MGFTTRFLDFWVAKMLKFTSDNANKHSLTSLLRILNDLELLKYLRILTYKGLCWKNHIEYYFNNNLSIYAICLISYV